MCAWMQKDDFGSLINHFSSFSFDNYLLFLSLNLKQGQQSFVNPPARLAPDSVKDPVSENKGQGGRWVSTEAVKCEGLRPSVTRRPQQDVPLI